MVLLTVWSWERFPVGRPKRGEPKEYQDHDNLLRLPTWAYIWDVHSESSGDPDAVYRSYTNEFDNLTPEQVKMTIT